MPNEQSRPSLSSNKSLTLDQHKKIKHANNSWSSKLTANFAGTEGSFAKSLVLMSWTHDLDIDNDIDNDIDIDFDNDIDIDFDLSNRRSTEDFFTKKAIFLASEATWHANDCHIKDRSPLVIFTRIKSTTKPIYKKLPNREKKYTKILSLC